MEERLVEVPEDRAERVRAAGKLWVEHEEAFKLGRTNDSWTSWLYGTPQVSGRVTQVAVAWVLGTVFVRFCEDNRLIPEPYFTGPDAERRDLAEARYRQYVEDDQDPTFRGWLERAFAELGSGQAGKLLFDERRNPLYQIPVSHDGARALVEFWRERGEDGELVHDFTDPLNEDGTKGWDTRFLGDLYQDLSEAARKTYALLQTPEFVEEFILDRTMNPVVRELGGRFGELKMIDPTCGSGHFVLGAFRRMVRLWAEREPGRDVHERVRDALNSVHGVDINPFAVAIARFRLLISAMAAAGVQTLEAAGRYDWPIQLAVGDSLIKARQLELTLIGEESGDPLADFSYATEDVHDYPGILEHGQYDVVVGNPPYITVKDKKLNALYRELYKSCTRQYALSVPFAERFFQLAKRPDGSGQSRGFVGQITANSFMKREFGRSLIETYFGHKVELTEVIDTSGAYIPGHGTPTVILVGRPSSGSQRSETVRAVLGIQGEPKAPKNAAEGVVWRAIVDQIDAPGSESNWISCVDTHRDRFAHFPWSLSGGSSSEVFDHINRVSDRTLSSLVRLIGRYTHTGSDDSYFAPSGTWQRRGVSAARIVPLVSGEAVRDWSASTTTESLFPYGEKLTPYLDETLHHLLWVNYSLLRNRREPGGTHEEIGLTWYEWSRWHPERYSVPLGIAFPFVATHNHFYLDRGGKVFNRHAPVIKLREDASENEYLQLLGLLNSSTACFWLKQVSQSKGNGGIGGGISDELWEHRFEFTGTKLEQFPLPPTYPAAISKKLDTLAQLLNSATPAAIIEAGTPTSITLREAESEWRHTRARMIAVQEELDWQVYSLYNLHSDYLRAPESEVPELDFGQRAFEIVLARRVENGEASDEWFKRHGSTPVTTLPEHWSEAYKATVQKRIDVIESSRAIGMVERPEYKRRWATEGWDALQEKALRSWLLCRIENRELWFQDGQPTILTRAQLTSALSLDEDFVSVAELYAPRKELATVVADLLANEHVPFLAALRYKPAGLKKRADWERVWDHQRQEDTAPDEPSKRRIRDTLPVPPKYTSADFLKLSYWRARGKLDVPKERFISYATGAISGTPDLFGWAGWDHREQAQALSTYFTNHDELSDEQLTPLFAGLLELQPWLSQWHDEFDALYGGSPAAFFAGYRATQQGEHGLTDDDLRAWRPGKPGKG
ncbi:BREX-2 system adenine-specific DNA-methyltransferase PglX [Streptomyces parvulus]